MRKNIVAGNWKMNCDLSETKVLLEGLTQSLPPSLKADVIVSPPYTSLHYAFENLKNTPIMVASQNINENDKGAFTGEISAKMLKSVGVNYAIVGHSERREIYKETDALLKTKLDQALQNEICPIFCIGEKLEAREEGKHFEVVKHQLEKATFHLTAEAFKKIVIAYEPVWAIGTGKTASPEQAQEIHQYIRDLIANKYNQSVADEVSILYGGSVKPANAKEIFGQADVDGGLIGGASLKATDFLAIVEAF